MTFSDPDTGEDSWHEPRKIKTYSTKPVDTIEPVLVMVEKNTVERLLTALQDHLENTQELLTKHLESLGETISKNKVVADLYREQIHEAEMLIEELRR